MRTRAWEAKTGNAHARPGGGGGGDRALCMRTRTRRGDPPRPVGPAVSRDQAFGRAGGACNFLPPRQAWLAFPIEGVGVQKASLFFFFFF